MGWVRGKLGGPYALFVHHSGQRHSDGSHARKFSPLRRSLNCSQQTTIFCVLEKKHLLTGIRAASSSPQISDKVLKPFLSIFGDRIFDSNVDRGMPNLAAAPWVRISGRDFLSGRPQSCPSLAPRVFEGDQFGFSVLLLEMAVAAVATSFHRS